MGRLVAHLASADKSAQRKAASSRRTPQNWSAMTCHRFVHGATCRPSGVSRQVGRTKSGVKPPQATKLECDDLSSLCSWGDLSPVWRQPTSRHNEKRRQAAAGHKI